MDKDLSACVSQESVRASTSALSCSQASLLAGPSRPEINHRLIYYKKEKRSDMKGHKRKFRTLQTTGSWAALHIYL